MSENQKPYPFSVCIKCCSGGTDIDPTAVVSDTYLSEETDGTYKLTVIKLDGSGGVGTVALASKKYVDDKTSGTSPGGSITVDAELSSTSENPVQNKAITEKLKPLVNGMWALSPGEENVYCILCSSDESPSSELVDTITGEPIRFASAAYVDGITGDIETALDNIIAIQNTLIGGGSV